MQTLCSSLQTKSWRQNQSWYRNGKHNECELFQLQQIQRITKAHVTKTFLRLNIETLEMTEKKHFMKNEDAFDWTENFDGIQQLENDNTLLYCLKMICDKGGSQTRSLREVYHFVKTQLEYLVKNNPNNYKHFVNILDGDTCFQTMKMFEYLLEKEKYKNIKSFVFVGDMHKFEKWYEINFQSANSLS